MHLFGHGKISDSAARELVFRAFGIVHENFVWLGHIVGADMFPYASKRYSAGEINSVSINAGPQPSNSI